MTTGDHGDDQWPPNMTADGQTLAEDADVEQGGQ